MSYESWSFHRHMICNHHKEGMAKKFKNLKLIDVNPLAGMVLRFVDFFYFCNHIKNQNNEEISNYPIVCFGFFCLHQQPT